MRYFRNLTYIFIFVFILLSNLTGQEAQPTEQPTDITAEEKKKDLLQNYFNAEGLNQWQHRFILEDLAKGTYNLIVKGTDIGGNVLETEAVDIQIDPDSDLPFSSITYPTQGSVISGSITILGSAGDDDAVDYVEVKLGEGEYIKGNGADYWSASINAEELTDGLYTITTRATDINGVTGKEKTIQFYYNREAPNISIDSINNGDLVSGKIDIQGTITDPNGIARATYSLDTNEIPKNIKLKGKLKEGNGEFSFPLDTRDLEDGPHVILLEGEDQRGGTGLAAILVYIDNTEPEIEFVYPADTSIANGIFRIAGRVQDEVGIQSLSYSYKDVANQDIPLAPGNPFWSVEVDFKGEKSANVRFQVTDTAGNAKQFTYKGPLDWEADKPTVQIKSPQPEGHDAFTLNRKLQGWVLDDDAPGGIIYSLDGGESIRIASGRSFNVELTDISPGAHTLQITPFDIHDLEGDKVSIKFTVPPGEPYISLREFKGKKNTPYTSGIKIDPSVQPILSGLIQFDSGNGKATIFFADTSEAQGAIQSELNLKKSDTPNTLSFNYELPSNVPYGYVPITIKAEDNLGSFKEETFFVWIKNLAANTLEHGFYLSSNEIIASNTLTPELRYVGYPLTNLELEPSTDIAILEQDSGFVRIKGRSSGKLDEVRIKGTNSKGTEFISPPFSLIVDTEYPRINLDQDYSGHQEGSLELKGTVSDDVGGLELYYFFPDLGDSGGPKKVNISEEKGQASFSFNINSSTIPLEGAAMIIQVKDLTGKVSEVYQAFFRSPSPEEVKGGKLLPLIPGKTQPLLPERILEKQLILRAGVIGTEKASNLAVTVDGEESYNLTGFPLAQAEIPLLKPGTHTLAFSGEYGEGKKLAATQKITIAPEVGGIRNLKIQNTGFQQGREYLLTSDTALEGAITGLNQYSSALYSIDGGDSQSIKLSKGDNGQGFSIPLKGLSYGLHTIRLDFTDAYGRQEYQDLQFYLISSEKDRNISDEEGIYLLHHPQKVWRGQQGIQFRFHGREIKEFSIQGNQGFMQMEEKDSILTLTPQKEGYAEKLVLKITTIDGDFFESEPFNVSTDVEAPKLSTAIFEENVYYGQEIILTGSLDDNQTAPTLSYSFDNSNYEPLILFSGKKGDQKQLDEESILLNNEAPMPWEFHTFLATKGLEDGPISLFLKVQDLAGNTSTYQYLLIKDTTPPELAQILPRADEAVNGAISAFFSVQDQWSEEYQGSFFLSETENAPVGKRESEDASGEVIVPEKLESLQINTNDFTQAVDLSPYTQLPEQIQLSLTDKAGNSAQLDSQLLFDAQNDLPNVQIHLPMENAVIFKDTIVSGTLSDDDGIQGVEYRIDEGEFLPLPPQNSFEILLMIEELTDNEHFIEVRAFDINGVYSETKKLNFQVSREIPIGRLLTPELGTTNRGKIMLEGEASDANDISAIYLSLDNGHSFNKAYGTTQWSYPLNTEILVDGVYMVLIKIIDGYGIQAIYSSLLTIDNSPPDLQVSLPMDGSVTTDEVLVQLRVKDDLVVRNLQYQIHPLELDGQKTTSPSGALLKGDFHLSEVVIDSIDISSLPEGRYNLSILGYDEADNEVVVSRNIIKKDPEQKSVPKLLFPLSGSTIKGQFRIEGRVEGDFIPETVVMLREGQEYDVIEINEQGYFSMEIQSSDLADGMHSFTAAIDNAQGEQQLSNALDINYRQEGPWIQITSIQTGDFVSDRPWIKGNTGYQLLPGIDPKMLSKEDRKAIEVESISYSLDNGQNFFPVKPQEKWKFRLETQELDEGDLNILVQAKYRNGEKCLSNILVFVDETAPSISIVTPEEGKAFNDEVTISGTAFDKNGLSDVSVMLRKGSKNRYEVPQFIQGLYFDTHFMGATYWEAGLGLTFFEDNVKLQILGGMAPPGRFNGNVLGIKLLANVVTIPYGYYFGPDWDFLSSSIAVGSVFEYFSMTEGVTDPDEAGGLVLGAAVAQIELVKIKVRNTGMFNTYSLYQENQLWFISSDVQGGLTYRFSLGLRVDVF